MHYNNCSMAAVVRELYHECKSCPIPGFETADRPPRAGIMQLLQRYPSLLPVDTLLYPWY